MLPLQLVKKEEERIKHHYETTLHALSSRNLKLNTMLIRLKNEKTYDQIHVTESREWLLILTYLKRPLTIIYGVRRHK